MKRATQQAFRHLNKKRQRFHLAALDTAVRIEDMDIPGFRLHPLKGDRKGLWSISVIGNRRISFEFRDGSAYVKKLDVLAAEHSLAAENVN